MNTITKTIFTALLLLILVAGLLGAVKAFNGNYLQNAPFITSGLLILAIIAGVFLIVIGIRRIWKTMALLAIISLQTCSYAKSNQQVVVSTDCGMTWQKID